LPQALLPLVPVGATPLDDRMSVVCRDGRWTYFCGVEPVFFHDQESRKGTQLFAKRAASPWLPAAFKGGESAEAIRAALDAGCIDEGVCGDWNEIRSELI